MKNSLILIPFNAHLGDVCDYAEQTLRLLSKSHTVLGIALGNPLSLYHDFGSIWRRQFFISHWGARVFRPIMVIPFQRFEQIKRLNFFLNILAINVWLLWRRQPKLLWFFEPRYLSLFLRFLFFRFAVFDCVDYFSAYQDWQAEQNFCLKKASLVVANSRTLRRKYRSVRPDILTVPLGFSLQDMPVAGRQIKKQPPLTFGFLGAIGYRLDFDFLEQLFEARPKDAFVFLGPQNFNLQTSLGRKNHRLFQTLIQQKKLQWLPKLSRQKAWLKARKFDVGLIPYDSRDPFNKYSFPMKVIEYFYQGLPVVAADIQELARYPEFAYLPQRRGWRGLGSFLSRWDINKQKKQRAIAREHTWEKKISTISRYLDERMRRQSSQE